MNRPARFFIANGLFALIVAVGAMAAPSSGVHPLYLVLLFALCSSPLLNLARLNDRYALLALFSAVFFQFYGLLDLINLFRTLPGTTDTDSVLSDSEMVILAGGALVHSAYRLVSRPYGVGLQPSARDWRISSLILVGASLWATATAASFYFKVFVIKAQNADAVAKGLGSLGPFETIGFLLANLVQPLGLLFLAYAYCRYRKSLLLPVIIAMVLAQLVFGFIVDSKGDALIGAVLVAVTHLLVNGRLPKTWVAAIAAFVLLAFPILQANRTVRATHGYDSSEVLQSLTKVFEAAVATSDSNSKGRDRAATFAERLSLKGSVEMIVRGTGTVAPFQNGYTLLPIVSAFIPRVVWPDKPDIQTGQILNKEFKVSSVAYTYISPSHLGELYWNFGWTGVVGGMTFVGLLLGYLGRRFDGSRITTMTGILVLVVTIKFLILGAEGSIAVQYVQWLRAMAIVGILHLLFASQRVIARKAVTPSVAVRPQPLLQR